MNKLKAFTLIELLIVIAIIGIIGAIAVPALTGNVSPSVWVQNGTVCEQGMKWSVSQGYKTQIVGPSGLPLTCPPEQEGKAI
ncbi:MAG: prepilin-type N-terminal cleavage/methylation domain-containing protein [Hydrotalea sp. AMD]|uniref:prepilin-type N-terminal cleavage/methylation domain-containing protein n=1 Tax=Hydrotalea sp. AMD TaxID=2501297 RepID=UPI001027FD3E|nr:prepilin-type N-terminal cleavage/methylation domain-containing protein [Hydrotalea sp. AMD]RWZ87289.1 MAG: prepilin-type N-terminal cleavage/methylation domain-containing protein [Hydrotalea sp. AMD]